MGKLISQGKSYLMWCTSTRSMCNGKYDVSTLRCAGLLQRGVVSWLLVMSGGDCNCVPSGGWESPRSFVSSDSTADLYRLSRFCDFTSRRRLEPSPVLRLMSRRVMEIDAEADVAMPCGISAWKDEPLYGIPE